MHARRLGIFTSGFRWSGSSAVSDWLSRYGALVKPAGTESTIGELRALNFGVQNLLLVAEGKIVFGERLARWALYPDPRQWRSLFGRSLYRARGLKGGVDKLIDQAILGLLKGKLRPRLEYYRSLLDDHLGSNALVDDQYIELVRELVAALQRFIDGGPIPVEESPELAGACSGLFALFYDRLASREAIPVFDNAIAGMNARYYRLLTPEFFEKQLIYLVHRDPRDQFAEQVKHSVRTLPFMVDTFIRDYRANVATTQALVEHFRRDPKRSVHSVSFEEFVCSPSFRMNLADEVCSLLADFDLPTDLAQGDFNADQSRRNIGAWKSADLGRQMNRIVTGLGKHLRPEAD